MNIQKTSVDEFKSGAGVVGTTPIQLPSFPATKGVTIRSGGNVRVGDSATIAASGFHLAAGESVTIRVNASDKIWIVGESADQPFSYLVT